MRERLCTWHCGRKTSNISGICHKCWQDRNAIYQARKVREAIAEKSPVRVRAGKALAAWNKARAVAPDLN
jgi:predicted amidophosphoribosyltransferase